MTEGFLVVTVTLWTFCYLGYIHLANHVFTWPNILVGFGKIDTTTLATWVWLADIRFVLFGSGVGLEVTITEGHRESGEREKIKTSILCSLKDLYRNSNVWLNSNRLTLQGGTMCEERCCTPSGRVLAYGSYYVRVNPSCRFHSCQENGWFSAWGIFKHLVNHRVTTNRTINKRRMMFDSKHLVTLHIHDPV